ncbi:MAG: tetratricopeptide repeat protein [Gemmatimonadota bacterium]
MEGETERAIINGTAIACIALPPLRAQAPTSPIPPDLAAAQVAYDRAPQDRDALIWLGRRIAYTGAYQRAIDLYTIGLERHPDSPFVLRHRGHRYLSIRDTKRARADLERAWTLVRGQPDLVEPDGQPNARGIPTSTLHSNIRYHLALAYFLDGDFALAAPIWAEDARVAANLDQRVAATYWWVLSLAYLGRRAEVAALLAPIDPSWEIIENGSYHRLLLYMKGALAEDRLLTAGADALERQTVGTGVGQWHAANGRTAEARAAWQRVLAGNPAPSFGVLAAERGLARLR